MNLLNYIDLFGTESNFYTKNKRRFYSLEGGILSIICIFCCIIVFFIMGAKDILHQNPISNSSSIPSVGYKRVKYGTKEKLWIPWRIIDYNEKFINFTKILYPVVTYWYGEKDPTTGQFPLEYQVLKYSLCNETDFANRSESYYIDVPLNQLYCTEIEDVYLGGGWTADYMYFIQIDVFLCEDGIEYDETSNKCTSYDNLVNSFEDDISWAFEYFYPIVQFQPTNYNNPVIVTYKSHFYNFSKFLNKAERIYIQEYTLKDDKSLFINSAKNSTYWGYISSETDTFYSIEVDPLNQTPSSRLYSLSVYLDMGLVLYIRSYNKLFTILAESFPIFNIVFYIFNFITYLIKTITIEKDIMESIFEKNIKKRKKFNFNNNIVEQLKCEQSEVNNIKKESNNVFTSNNKDFSIKNPLQSQIINCSNHNLNDSNNIKVKNYFDYRQRGNEKIIVKNKFNIPNIKNNYIFNNDDENIIKNKSISKTNLYINMKENKKKLFNYFYYILTFFIKDIKQKYSFLTDDYSISYNFMCDILDITSYINLNKKFWRIYFLIEKGYMIESENKININNESFLRKLAMKDKKIFLLASKEMQHINSFT